MAKLSSSAWIAHDLGLATAVGGTMFGRLALAPALREISGKQRDTVSDTAWRRFSWINLAAHGLVAATWFAGRAMLSGREATKTSRQLTLVKDGFVVASLATGIASVILGRMLGKRLRERESVTEEKDVKDLRRTVGALGIANLAANAGVAALTTALAMEGSKSVPFSWISRRLP